MTLTVSLLTCQTLRRFSILNQNRLMLIHSKLKFLVCLTVVDCACDIQDVLGDHTHQASVKAVLRT